MWDKNILIAFCVLVVLVSLGTVGWIMATGQFYDVDGLMLISVCLMTAGMFGGLLAYETRGQWVALLSFPAQEAQGGDVIVGTVEEHGGGTRLYLAVWGGLLGLTLLEVLLAYQKLPLRLMLAALMGLSVVKAGLIMAYFMHLRFERMNLILIVVPTLVIVICLLFMFFPDSFRILELGAG